MKAEGEESFAVQPKWYFTACLFLFIRKAKNNRDFSTMHSTFIRFGNNLHLHQITRLLQALLINFHQLWPGGRLLFCFWWWMSIRRTTRKIRRSSATILLCWMSENQGYNIRHNLQFAKCISVGFGIFCTYDATRKKRLIEDE